MSIRESFQPTVDEFISDLTTFATGSYLREEEKTHWDQPFDPAAIPLVRSALEEYLSSLESLAGRPDVDAICGAINTAVNKLVRINEDYANAIIEPEEIEQLNDFFKNSALEAGLDSDALGQLPLFDE
ncbi:hypothetical protein GP475_05955 [Corynebacterium poyangense]|uniref:Uncharacterized protein n=1 Tax=Corynebacterium poyangense TaxID=2684405 RepID=A0A7H0SNV8_9CORY|nr:hypothetical protein [Corynebacterium poyangense]MBZ8177789.1 hypothetical protein [Corynebacterium poyangense]QNQ90233.1 hypothetical protein GP475_05955 [Corynebacterium poyangense]